MSTRVEPAHLMESINVLLVGNNPIELSAMLNKIAHTSSSTIHTETAFDARSLLARLVRFRANFILIDDNIGTEELNETVNALANNRRTKNVLITILKNSNYTETITSTRILDYILKKSLTAEILYISIRNSIKTKRAQLNLAKAYNKRKKLLLDLMR
jgi:hypothetical protein